MQVRWALSALTVACAWLLWSGVAAADDPLAGWSQGMSEGELARQAGLGVVEEDPPVNGAANTIVTGKGNATSAAHADGKIVGDVVADTVKAGDVRHVATGPAKGFNVFQINTAPNVNQIANQSIVVNIINHGTAKAPK